MGGPGVEVRGGGGRTDLGFSIAPRLERFS